MGVGKERIAYLRVYIPLVCFFRGSLGLGLGLRVEVLARVPGRTSILEGELSFGPRCDSLDGVHIGLGIDLICSYEVDFEDRYTTKAPITLATSPLELDEKKRDSWPGGEGLFGILFLGPLPPTPATSLT